MPDRDAWIKDGILEKSMIGVGTDPGTPDGVGCDDRAWHQRQVVLTKTDLVMGIPDAAMEGGRQVPMSGVVMFVAVSTQ